MFLHCPATQKRDREDGNVQKTLDLAPRLLPDIVIMGVSGFRGGCIASIRNMVAGSAGD